MAAFGASAWTFDEEDRYIMAGTPRRMRVVGNLELRPSNIASNGTYPSGGLALAPTDLNLLKSNIWESVEMDAFMYSISGNNMARGCYYDVTGKKFHLLSNGYGLCPSDTKVTAADESRDGVQAKDPTLAATTLFGATLRYASGTVSAKEGGRVRMVIVGY